MARAPIYQGNQVGLAQTTGARFRASDQSGGGRAIASSAGRLAQAGFQIVDQQEKQNAEFDDTMARKLAIEYQVSGSKIVNDYSQLEGINAISARLDTDKALETTRDDIYSRATTPRMRAALEERVSLYHSTYAGNVGERVASELKKTTVATYNAQVELSKESAAAAWENPKLLRGHIDTGLSVIDDLAASQGWSPSTLATERFKYESGIHKNVVDQQMAAGDTDVAEAYLEAHADSLSLVDELDLRNDLKPHIEQREYATGFAEAIGTAAPVTVGGKPTSSTPSTSFAHPLRAAAKGISSPYGAARSNGKKHGGVDYPAPLGTAIYPASGGRVVSVDTAGKGNAGVFVVIDHGDGVTTSYSHMNGTKLKVGEIVGADTKLGGIGMTGHTEGPHLHMVARRNGQRINPDTLYGKAAPALSDAQQGPRRWNLDSVYSGIDRQADAQGWSLAKREGVKAYADRQVSRDEKLIDRQEDAAAREASRIVLDRGEGFTDISQIPRSVRDQMSPSLISSYTDKANANAAPKAVKANGDAVQDLNVMQILEPEKFAKSVNLGEYVGSMTPAELDTLRVQQARIIKEGLGGATVSLNGNVTSAISLYGGGALGYTKRAKPDQDARYLKMHSLMRDDLSRMTGGKREPNEAETAAAFDRAALRIGADAKQTVGEALGARGNIPNDVYQRIKRNMIQDGEAQPTPAQIAQEYFALKGQAGYW